ncbi:HET-domain-containing protein [Apiospora rasikravindrae]|uniref:HET-domain-containing protein n=1 Tax=Apiospora rasikravindrae TaxID=990691 RepID=A0ABR1TCR0_9PEZI
MSDRMWAQIRDTLNPKEAVSVISGYLKGGITKRVTFDPATVGPVDEKNRFKYDGLPGGSGSLHIRLLELLPASQDDAEVRCRLTKHRHVDCQGEYETLSYVWGDTSDPVPIHFDGKSLPISRNLYQALVDLRHQEKSRTLWVDAVCINQMDDKERSQQVSAMGQIYRGAKRVVIYLGAAYPHSTKTAYDLIEKCAAEATKIDFSLTEAITLSTLSQGSQIQHGFSKEEVMKFDTGSLLHLGGATWWARAWTAQEVLLAPDAVVVTGSHSMEWNRFCTGVDFGLHAGIIDAAICGMMIADVIRPYLSMHALRVELAKPVEAAERAGTTSAQRLLALLIHCRFRGATDPRDKVYAFLGLKDIDHSIPSTLLIKPNYSASCDDVYRNAAKQIVLHSCSLDILGACMPALPDASADLPSWVPDWNNTGPAPRPLIYDTFGGPRLSCASVSKIRTATFADADRKLVLSGHRITFIAALSPILQRPTLRDQQPNWVGRLGQSFLLRLLRVIFVIPLTCWGLWLVYQGLLPIVEHLGVLADWEAFALGMSPTNPVAPSKPAGAARRNSATVNAGGVEGKRERYGDGNTDDPLYVYWQTLCAGADAPGGPEETRELFDAWRAKLAPMFRLHARGVDRWLPSYVLYTYFQSTWTEVSVFTRYLEMAYERRLGRGANGYMVLVPGHTEVGDQIVLVKEGKVPLVLRSCKRGDDGGVGGQEADYTVVGEAYVEGTMDGEAFRDQDCAEILIH